MLTRQQIKANAKASFYAQYWAGVGFYALYIAIVGACSALPYLGTVAAILIMPPMMVGYSITYLKMYRGERIVIGDLFSGFQNFGRSLGGILWMDLWVFLWSLLFIVPGIIKSIAYSMTPYILADRPDVSPTDALKLSMAMTDGHKGELFVMYLSFIGWNLVTLVTFGIAGIFFVDPYYSATSAGFYQELSANYYRECASQA